MRIRHIAAGVVAAMALPVLALGLIDPLEGGMALLVAGALVLGTWLISRVPVPRLEWIAWLVAIVVGVLTIALAVTLPEESRSTGEGGLLSLSPWLIAGLVSYETAVLATIAGGVQYVVRLIRAVAASRPVRPPA